MLIYVIYDHQKKTISHPMVVESLKVAKDALREMNPANYNDLIVHPVCALNELRDLFRLSVNPQRELPDFLDKDYASWPPYQEGTHEYRLNEETMKRVKEGFGISDTPELASGAPSEAR